MLKSMRRNFKSFAPALWVVIITFIVALFAWFGLGGRDKDEISLEDITVAEAGGESITGQDYAQALAREIQENSQPSAPLKKSDIQQLNLPQSALQRTITRRLLLQLAQERHVVVTDKEFQEQVLRYPLFLDPKTGRFIGQKEYTKILSYYKISVKDFEQDIEDIIRLDKIQKLLTAGIAIAPEEIWESYRKDKETARIEYLLLEKDKIKLEAEPRESELEAYFSQNKDKFRIPEKREAAYVFLNHNDLKKEVELSSQEIQKYYKENLAQFQSPEETEVSRIYLPFTGREKEEVRAEMRSLSERLKKNEDFGELAKKYSQDAKAAEGGAWGAFEWRSLSDKEQEAVRTLKEGQTSDIIELSDGLSLLKVTRRKETSDVPLEEARPRIKSILEEQKAQTLASERIGRLEKEAKKAKSLEKAAARLGFKVEKTGWLKQGDPLAEVDPSGAISQALFQLEENEVSEPLHSYQGVGLAQLLRIAPSRPATLEEVRGEVLDRVAELKKKEKILDRLTGLRSHLAGSNWEDVSLREGLEYKAVNEHKRGQYLSSVEENEEVDQLSFSLPLNAVSEPVEFKNGYLVLRVLSRQEVTREDFEKNKDATRQELLQSKRNFFLASYLAQLRKERGVEIQYDSFLQVVSAVLSRYEE